MTRSKRSPGLLIIDPSIEYPEQDGVTEIVRDWPGRYTVLRPALEPAGPSVAEAAADAAAIVLMGSRASVHDGFPWLDALRGGIADELARANPRPMLGICFGHQLIAHAAGGRVGWADPAAHGRVRGIFETALSGGRLVPGEHTLTVVASHAEVVEQVPPGFAVTGSRPTASCDAMEHLDRPVFSVQFHPEAREDFLSRRGIDATGQPAVFEDGRRVLAAFRRLVLSLHAARAS